MTHTIDTLMALAMEAASAELAWDIGSSKHPHDKRIYGVDEANAALHAALTEALTFRPDWADFANGRECGRLEHVQPFTYSSTQATKCACCGVHKHTPLRVDFMGGYMCLTCIDIRLEVLDDMATMYAKQLAHWIGKYDALLEQQLATTPQELNDENVIAYCVERGIRTAQPVVKESLSTQVAQPVREPMTDGQIQEVFLSIYRNGYHGCDLETAFACAIERFHGIGGGK